MCELANDSIAKYRADVKNTLRQAIGHWTQFLRQCSGP